mmetsp:Transcript_49012/g.127939  ORF Transcript_49012/g.127939 Transcript_49012/m.127939 type:complete len:281 (-) Transcript_49012:294-1136(-)
MMQTVNSAEPLSKPHAICTAEDPSPLSPMDATNESEEPNGGAELLQSPGRTPPAVLSMGTKRRRRETPTRRQGECESVPSSAAPSPLGGAEAEAPAASPDSARKIWMRPCNGCGVELHVRRTKCPDCGSVQLSKRAALSAKEAAAREAVEAQEQARLAVEAEIAASSLKLIAQAPKAAEPAMDASALPKGMPVSPSAQLPSPMASAAPTSESGTAGTAAARAQAISAAVAKLTPEARTKLRRLHKLRALLANVPASMRSAADSGADADAIAILASVAARC